MKIMGIAEEKIFMWKMYFNPPTLVQKKAQRKTNLAKIYKKHIWNEQHDFLCL